MNHKLTQLIRKDYQGAQDRYTQHTRIRPNGTQPVYYLNDESSLLYFFHEIIPPTNRRPQRFRDICLWSSTESDGIMGHTQVVKNRFLIQRLHSHEP